MSIITAEVRGARTSREVAAYLPSNYQVIAADTDNMGVLTVHIEGRDVAGWTFEDYVAPRLASGWMFAARTDHPMP